MVIFNSYVSLPEGNIIMMMMMMMIIIIMIIMIMIMIMFYLIWYFKSPLNESIGVHTKNKYGFLFLATI